MSDEPIAPDDLAILAAHEKLIGIDRLIGLEAAEKHFEEELAAKEALIHELKLTVGHQQEEIHRLIEGGFPQVVRSVAVRMKRRLFRR